jgi:hypothetical protein
MQERTLGVSMSERSVSVGPWLTVAYYTYYDEPMRNAHTKRNTESNISRRRERMSISLSRDSAEFLRALSAEENSHVSTVVENLIEQLKLDKERAELNARISAHYDSLADAVEREESAWGEVGAAGLADIFENEIDAAAQETPHSGKP